MIVVDSYLDAPGCCAICQGVTTPTIDTGRDRDSDGWARSGRMYVCRDCVVALADMFGFTTPEKRAELDEEIGDLKATIGSLEDDLSDTQKALDGLTRVRNRRKQEVEAA